MTFGKLTLCFLFIGLSSCNVNLDSKVLPLVENPPPKQNNVDVASDYVQKARLNLIHTNELYSEVKSNSVTIAGTGTDSTYKIQYSFNSGTFQSFNISETSKMTNCGNGQERLTLKSKNGSTELFLVSFYQLVPNTDYTVEIEFPNSCRETRTTFDLIAWIGNSTTEPKRAFVCENDQLGQTYFFDTVNMMTIYTSVAGKEKFLDHKTFCGESVSASTISCGKTGFSHSIGVPASSVTCTTEDAPQNRKFGVSFNFTEKSAQVTCATGDEQITFFGIFNSCELKMIDYSPFRNL